MGFQAAAEAALAKHLSRTVNFVPNKTTMKPDGKPILNNVVATLKKFPWMALNVIGQSTASGAYGQKLVTGRARVTIQYLKSKGVTNRMKASGKVKSSMMGIKMTASGMKPAPAGCTPGFGGKTVSRKTGRTKHSKKGKKKKGRKKKKGSKKKRRSKKKGKRSKKSSS